MMNVSFAAQTSITHTKKVIVKAECNCKDEFHHNPVSLFDAVTLALLMSKVNRFLTVFSSFVCLHYALPHMGRLVCRI